MSTTASTASQQSIVVTASGNTNNILFASYATDSGFPDADFIPAGVWSFDLNITCNDSNATDIDVYAKIYKYTSGGTSTLLFTSGVVILNNTSLPFSYFFDSFYSGVDLDLSDRIYVEFYT